MVVRQHAGQPPERGRGEQVDTKLYVGNLPYTMTDQDLRDLFGQAGELQDAVVIVDRDSRRSKGFGFVEFATEADAQKAIQMFNDHELQGRRLTVNVARPREERGGGGGGFSGGGGGGGGYGGGGRGGGGRGGGRGGRGRGDRY
jgi:RNA recognition motif-containing protein